MASIHRSRSLRPASAICPRHIFPGRHHTAASSSDALQVIREGAEIECLRIGPDPAWQKPGWPDTLCHRPQKSRSHNIFICCVKSANVTIWQWTVDLPSFKLTRGFTFKPLKWAGWMIVCEGFAGNYSSSAQIEKTPRSLKLNQMKENENDQNNF